MGAPAGRFVHGLSVPPRLQVDLIEDSVATRIARLALGDVRRPTETLAATTLLGRRLVHPGEGPSAPRLRCRGSRRHLPAGPLPLHARPACAGRPALDRAP